MDGHLDNPLDIAQTQYQLQHVIFQKTNQQKTRFKEQY